MKLQFIVESPKPLGIDAEVANFFTSGPSKATDISDKENTRLRWMVHKRVLSVMVITYFSQTLDKGTINFASIMGIQQDAHLVGQQVRVSRKCFPNCCVASMLG